jgi:hypothetical protein
MTSHLLPATARALVATLGEGYRVCYDAGRHVTVKSEDAHTSLSVYLDTAPKLTLVQSWRAYAGSPEHQAADVCAQAIAWLAVWDALAGVGAPIAVSSDDLPIMDACEL